MDKDTCHQVFSLTERVLISNEHFVELFIQQVPHIDRIVEFARRPADVPIELIDVELQTLAGDYLERDFKNWRDDISKWQSVVTKELIDEWENSNRNNLGDYGHCTRTVVSLMFRVCGMLADRLFRLDEAYSKGGYGNFHLDVPDEFEMVLANLLSEDSFNRLKTNCSVIKTLNESVQDSGIFDHDRAKLQDALYTERINARSDANDSGSDDQGSKQLFIENIDSFAAIRNLKPQQVVDLLVNGRFDKTENDVQTAIEHILGMSFHKEDWGGEQNDLYTANIEINGGRCQTAFLLKGNGCKSKEMQIKDCGKNGDQILRLFKSPAKLFVIQYVGPISENVVDMARTYTVEKRSSGQKASYCIIDGQDTARLLKAYGLT